jgi:hypothetical protein
MELVKTGLMLGRYNVVVDNSEIYLNVSCAVCLRNCETGAYLIDETGEPVCDTCGKEYAEK